METFDHEVEQVVSSINSLTSYQLGDVFRAMLQNAYRRGSDEMMIKVHNESKRQEMTIPEYEKLKDGLLIYLDRTGFVGHPMAVVQTCKEIYEAGYRKAHSEAQEREKYERENPRL